MAVLMSSTLWGNVEDEILQKMPQDQARALQSTIRLMPLVDRRSVYAEYIFHPKGIDYPYRVGYVTKKHREWWAGDSYDDAVRKLEDDMSPQGLAIRVEHGIPIPGK